MKYRKLKNGAKKTSFSLSKKLFKFIIITIYYLKTKNIVATLRKIIILSSKKILVLCVKEFFTT